MKSARLFFIHCVFAVLSLAGLRLHAGSPPIHGWNPSGSNPPYGLTNEFAPGQYEHCRWGVVMSSGCATGLPWDVLSYTPLTSFQSNILYGGGGSLFLDLCGIDAIIPIENIAAVGQLDATNRLVTTPLGNHYSLFRKLHFQQGTFRWNDPRGLTGINDEQLTSSSRKAIIFIHGWNPESNPDHYTGAEFTFLETRIERALAGDANWQFFKYRWEADADAGPVGVSAAVHGTRAAEIGHLHGQYLGKLIEALTDAKIEKIHFFAHSAGSWVARGAAKQLLRNRQGAPGSIRIQITLLDPFIPGQVPNVFGMVSAAVA